jgi:hypothetical protein
MNFLLPSGLFLAALALPILLLYMLKLRRKQALVSSTLLWTQLLRDQQANAPWQKLKRNLLLILQLLILAALALAFARPAIETPALASGSVIILLDASASMNATDVIPSRFESARRAIHTLLSGLPADSRVTLILVGATPEALTSSETDKSLVRRALDAAQPSQGGADWQSAFALAAGAARGGADLTTLILSDGGLPESGLPSLPGEARYVPIGETSDNLAITALALRPPQLFAEATNYDTRARSVLLSIYFGENLLTARQLDIQPGQSQNLTLDDLPNAPGVYRARITNLLDETAPDSMSLDDAAFAVYQTSFTRRVLLTSSGNLFIEQLLAALPNIQPFRALPPIDGALVIPAESFNLYIFDGVAPPIFPDGNLLLINPPGNSLFQIGGMFTDMGNVQVHESPLTRYVDWSNVHILQAKTVDAPAWAETLIEADGGALVFAGETGGRRVAVVTFDLRESDLPLQTAYPILFSNLINYLVPPSAFDATQALAPGESLAIAPTDAEQVVVVSPSGKAFRYVPNQSGIVFTETDELGYYAVNFVTGDSTTAEYFAVNLFDPAESDIRPRASVNVGRAEISAQASERVGQREFWPWLASLALIVLMIEWQAYYRKPWKFISGTSTHVDR